MNPRLKAAILEGKNNSCVELSSGSVGLRCYAGWTAGGDVTMEIFITEGGAKGRARVSLGAVFKDSNGRVEWLPGRRINSLLETAFPVDKEAKA